MWKYTVQLITLKVINSLDPYRVILSYFSWFYGQRLRKKGRPCRDLNERVITQLAEPHKNKLESENSNHLLAGIPIIIHEFSHDQTE